MTYASGTITDANPGPAFVAVIEAALTANGWTLEDTNVISTSTYRTWKNPAANNVTGKDYFISLRYTTTGAGSYGHYVHETWDPTSNLGQGFVTGYTGTQSITAPNHRLLDTAVALDSSFITGTPAISLPSSSFGYWVSATANRLILLVSSDPTNVYYVGNYVPDQNFVDAAGAAMLPLIRARVPEANATNNITRLPQFVGSSAPSSLVDTVAASTMTGNFPTPSIPAGDLSIGVRRGIRVPIRALNRNVLGYIPDLLLFRCSTTVARGDTIAIDGVNWVMSTYSDGGSHSFCTAFRAV